MNQTTKEKLNIILVFLIIMVIFLSFIVFMLFQLLPTHLCQKWGGALYTDNNCYITDNMEKCVSPSGLLLQTDKAVIVPNFELNTTEDK